jgi:hypothetical protein
LADGSLIERTAGTPQGGVISPILANLYLHYGFDLWMLREFPNIPFERYADDVICHCSNETQAARLKDAIEHRFATCYLTLHPQKTKIAYCKDGRRRGTYPTVQFDFLGYAFRPRRVGHNGKAFVGFNPAISPKSATAIRQVMRDWRLHRRSESTLEDLARDVNPVVRGWINYYGSYYRSALYRVFNYLNIYLTRWAMMKYKDLRQRRTRAREWVRRIELRQPNLFAHWALLPRLDGGSRMS